MKENTLMQAFQLLPPEGQKQVADFIAFLQARYGAAPTKRRAKVVTNLSDEAFVGMWRNRADMQDSSGWVKKLRAKEWGIKE